MSNQKLKLCRAKQAALLKKQLTKMLAGKLASESSISKKRQITDLTESSRSICNLLTNQSIGSYLIRYPI